MVFVALLVLLAVVLAWPVPRLLPRWKALRLVPGAGLLLWQSVALAGVVSALLIAPLVILQQVRQGRDLPEPSQHLTLLLVGLGISGFVAARLALQGHLVGTRLRRDRREHADLLDLLSSHQTMIGAKGRQVRVIEHQTPTAYCIPGRMERLVISDSTIDRLGRRELDAVLAHEQTHLDQRHDLLVEFFTVLHTTVPEPVRSGAGMTEARLLVERLADLEAVKQVGAVPLARALYTLARGAHPESALAANGTAPVRLLLLADDAPHRGLAASALALSACVLAGPLVLAALTLLT